MEIKCKVSFAIPEELMKALDITDETPVIASISDGRITVEIVDEDELYEEDFGDEDSDCDCEDCAVGLLGLIVQGIATSIDALSVGLEIGHYNLAEACVSSLVIALVTFIICMFGVWAGKKFGNMLSNKATVFGGVILVGIGIYIFIKGILGI